MTQCKCAKCRRREIYKATGMTLSLAWNKKLNRSCYLEAAADIPARARPADSVSQEIPAAKKAS